MKFKKAFKIFFINLQQLPSIYKNYYMIILHVSSYLLFDSFNLHQNFPKYE